MDTARVRVRPERPTDHAAVEAMVEAAFGRAAEAGLVSSLRRDAAPLVSLVAELEAAPGRPVGHVMVSPVRLESYPEIAAGGLAPVAVAPARQRRGVGGALVRAALEAAGTLGWRAVFVLGEPAYYGRFGFVPAAPYGLHYESPAFDAGFQVRELMPGVVTRWRGWVRYHGAFAGV